MRSWLVRLFTDPNRYVPPSYCRYCGNELELVETGFFNEYTGAPETTKRCTNNCQERRYAVEQRAYLGGAAEYNPAPVGYQGLPR